MAGTGITAALSFLYTRTVARELGPASFAQFAAVLAAANIVLAATGIINPTVARFSAEYSSRNRPGMIRTLAWQVGRRAAVYGSVAILAGIVLSKAAMEFLHIDSSWPIILAGLIVYGNLLISVVRGVLRGTERFGALNASNILEGASRWLFGILLLSLAANTSMALLAFVAGGAVVLLVSPLQLKKVWRNNPSEPVESEAIRQFVLPILLFSISMAVFQNADMLFAQRVLVGVDAGIYGAAVALAKIMGVLVTPFSTMMLPALTSLHNKCQKAHGTFLRIVGYFLAVVSLPMVLFCVWPDAILVGAFDSRYAGGGNVLFLLACARLCGYLSHMICLFYAAKRDFSFLVIHLPAALVLLVALNIWCGSAAVMAGTVAAVEGATLLCLIVFMTCHRRQQ